MKNEYRELSEAFAGYVSGLVSGESLKAIAAPFGIYQQRDGRFMVRIRVNGGEIECAQLRGIADVCEAAGGYARLTSRQDIQLHGLHAEQVIGAVQASDRLGLPFKGGGGNTYRNTVVGADSGLAPESVFDVYPYAHALNRAMRRVEKAYALPRKFKVAFFACADDTLRAAIHDLGFVACVRDGKRGFRVYAGGGLGRESETGVCLSEFLPAKLAIRAAVALIALFYDHGDRANRQRARLRFLVKRIGAEAFMRLFWEYYVIAQAPRVSISEGEARVPDEVAACGHRDRCATAPGFSEWVRIAVYPTRFGASVKSVRLYVPYGKLTAAQLRLIAELAAGAGSSAVRLLTTQDVLIPLVPQALLPELHSRLASQLAEIDLTFRSYKGHIMTCVGASVCRIGMVDAPAVADRLAAALDRFLPADTPEKIALLRLVADEVRISGCPNACSGHPAARVGIGCVSQNVDGAVQPFGRVFTGAGVIDGLPRLSRDEQPGRFLSLASTVDVALARLRALAGV